MDRILVAVVKQESSSFVPRSTTLEAFKNLTEGAAIQEQERGSGREIDGVSEAAERMGVELVPIVDAVALSGPPLSDETFEHRADTVYRGMRRNLGNIDGVLLILHGAMVSRSLEDTEGEFLSGFMPLPVPTSR